MSIPQPATPFPSDGANTTIVDQPAQVASTYDAEAWTDWPEKCKNFRPGLQNAWNVRQFFDEAEKTDGYRPSDAEVLHVTEYSGKGTKLEDRFLNEQELTSYLARTNPSPCEQEGRICLFFASSDRGWNAACQSYMRRWWSHYSVPMDIVAAFASSPGAAFRTLTEDIVTPGLSSKQILHLSLSCDLNLPPLDEESLSYCKGGLLALPMNCLSHTISSSIYIQYDALSRTTTILVLDYSPIYSALRRACEGATVTGDPFIFLVSCLDCLLASSRSISGSWFRDISTYRDTIFKEDSNYSSTLRDLASSREVFQYATSTLSLLGECIWRMRDKHRQLTEIMGPCLDLFNFIDDSFSSLAHDIHAVAQHAKSFDNTAESFIEIALGLTQIRNGESMRTIAEENHKQAVAAQAMAKATRKDSETMKNIALDTKRDSEVMKTITVVTLIYLPATFVCTLLSMGMFEWPTLGEEAGSVKIARTGWIFLAITIPLTIITCSIAWWKYAKNSAKALAELKSQTDCY